jgi:2-polyprenyl-3-methyl-5-hydroxy-6-metoxy-1,4-benzoquinol methylase
MATYHKEIYERDWREILRGGREDLGDLEISMLFLNKADLLRREFAILEIGCGVGKLCNRLYEMGYENITGTDISPSAVAYGKNRFPHLNLLAMDASAVAFPDERFDVCLSFDLIEHLPDVDAHLREVLRILKPAGKYLFQTPNMLSNAVYETIIRKSFVWRIYHPSLQLWWTLRKRLLNAGFVKVGFIKIPPVSDYKLRQISKFTRWGLRLIPWRYLPIFLQTNFFVIASR